jgi:hypothetical protein
MLSFFNLKSSDDFLSFLCIHTHNFLEDFQDLEIIYRSKEPLLISLGGDCRSATFINVHGYRVASFPFDWLFSDIKKLEYILKDAQVQI